MLSLQPIPMSFLARLSLLSSLVAVAAYGHGAGPAEDAPGKASGQLFGPSQLASYFSEGKLKQARTDFERGRYAQARAGLPTDDPSLPVRYLRAVAGHKAGLHKEASAELRALADEYAVLRPYCLSYAAASFEKLGKLSEAATALRLIPKDAVLYEDAQLSLARVLARGKSYEEAQKVLAALGNDDKALLATARLAAERRDAAAERAALLKIWASFPGSGAARDAAKRLGKPAKFPVEAQVARAEALIDQHLNTEGMKILKPLVDKVAPPSELGCRAHFAYGKAFRKERQHSKAIELLVPVVEQCKSDVIRPKALYILGYSQSVVDEARGVRTYETLAKDYPNHPFADDALYLAAELRLELADEDGALALYEQVAAHHWSGDFAAEARFKTFWIHWQRNQHAAGVKALDEILGLGGVSAKDEQIQRAQYWRARSLAALGESTAASDGFAGLIEKAKRGYYALLARARLEELDRPRAEKLDKVRSFEEGAEQWPLQIGLMAQEPHFLAGVELLRLGLPGAVSELLAVPRDDHTAEANLALFQILYSQGYERPARVIASGGMVDNAISESRELLEVNFPTAFRPLVEKHGKEAKVDPNLLQALIREESRFNPSARSSTGALGLTQLMPGTARDMARTLKIRRFRNASLLNPQQNIRIGSAYLGKLLSRWDGNKALAVASYNAGPNAVSRWLSTSPDADMDEWVEQIPVSETRNYVKRVLGSYDAYGLLLKQAVVPVIASGGQR